MTKKITAVTLVFTLITAFVPMPAKAQVGPPTVQDIIIGDLLIRATYTPTGQLAHVAGFEKGIFIGAYTFDAAAITATDVTIPIVFQSQMGRVSEVTTKFSKTVQSKKPDFDVEYMWSDAVSGTSITIKTKTLQSNLEISNRKSGLFLHQKIMVEYIERGALNPNSGEYNLLINMKTPTEGVMLFEPEMKLIALREAVLRNTELADSLKGYLSMSQRIGATSATPGAVISLMLVVGQGENIRQVITDLFLQKIRSLGCGMDCYSECVDDGLADNAASIATAGLGCASGSVAACEAGAAIVSGVMLGCAVGCMIGCHGGE